jgi:hypothetical protein
MVLERHPGEPEKPLWVHGRVRAPGDVVNPGGGEDAPMQATGFTTLSGYPARSSCSMTSSAGGAVMTTRHPQPV